MCTLGVLLVVQKKISDPLELESQAVFHPW